MALEDITRRGFLSALALAPFVSSASGSTTDQNDRAHPTDSISSGALDIVIGILEENKAVVKKESDEHGVPAVFTASMIYTEMMNRSIAKRSLDGLGSLVNANFTYGIGQVRLSTAMFLDGLDFNSAGFEKKSRYIKKLNDPRQNIHYVAGYLAYLKNRENRYSGISAEQFAKDPLAMAVVATEYQIGGRKSPLNEAGFNRYGYGVVWLGCRKEINDMFPVDERTRNRYMDFLAKYEKDVEAESADAETPLKYKLFFGGLAGVVVAGMGGLIMLRRFVERKQGIDKHKTGEIDGSTDLK